MSHSSSFSYGTVKALLGLVGLRASGGLVCGPSSAYVVYFGMSSWYFFFLVIGIVPKEASGPSQGFSSIRVYWSMSNFEHLGLFRSNLPHPNSKLCTVFFYGFLVLEGILCQNFKKFPNRLDRSSKFQFRQNSLKHV